MIKLYESATHIVIESKPAVLDRLVQHFAFKPDGYWYAPSYERYVVSKGKEGWDGFLRPVQRLGDTGAKAMRGRKMDIIEWAEETSYDLDTAKTLTLPFTHLTLDDIHPDLIAGDFELDDSQRRCIFQWLRHAIGINQVTVSGGKCLGKGTPVLMHDGSTKAVEDIAVSDLVMGPDSRPRRVLALGRGRAELYRVAQANGDAYVCNGDHLMALCHFKVRGNFYKKRTYALDHRVISVNDYLKLSKNVRANCTGYKVGIQFKERKTILEPYLLGIWLGDGHRNKPAVTTGDPEIKEFVTHTAFKMGLGITAEEGHGCENLYMSTGKRSPGGNPMVSALKKLKLWKAPQKFIPDSYLRNSRRVRLLLLAGLIDTDGSVKRNGQLEITSVYKTLAENIVWLARSLGYSASVKPKKTTCQTGATGLAYRVRITGTLSEVPVRVKRKMTGDCLKGGLRTRISVRAIGKGDYYGFELDGDGLFLLGDFTVTHNTAMFAGAGAFIKEHYPDAKLLYLTPSERLVRQSTKEMKRMLPQYTVGQYGGGKNEPDAEIVVCTVAMLNRHFHDLKCKGWFNRFMGVFFDECHHSASESSQKVLLSIPAFFRFGASDTVKEDDERKWNDIRGLFGPVLNVIKAAPLIVEGRIAKPHIYIVDHKEWNNQFEDVSYSPPAKSPAYVLVDDEWKSGRYISPVYERDDKGNIVHKEVKTAIKDDQDQWIIEQVPVTVPGLHLIEMEGVEHEIVSKWCLLRRTYDQAIIQFHERNKEIVRWAKHFSNRGLPTVVVCTRTLHVYILEAMLAEVINPDLVDILVGKDTSVARDACFEWFKQTPGAVLITPLVKEGVSINEIKAGVIADYVADFEVANQLVGRFIRQKKKGTDNSAEIVWFRDRQHPSLRRGCNSVFRALEQIEGYTFYDPAPEPESLVPAAQQGELNLA